MTAARSTILLAAALVVAGGAFDSPSLYVPGVALAILAAVARIWVGLAARRVRVEQLPGPWSIVEGEPHPLRLRLAGGRLPLPGGTIEHPLASRPGSIGMRLASRASLELRPLPRGRWRIAPATLSLFDPLRLHVAEIRAGRGQQIVVLPRIEPVRAREGTGRGNGAGALDGLIGIGAAGLDTRPIEFEIDGLQPYRHGSPASRIHWPTVARRGELVEHRLVAGADPSPLVVLDSSRPADRESLDAAVRAAASLCVHLAARGGCALLLSGERRALDVDPQLRGWEKAHARLAVVERGGPPPVLDRVTREETIFWVTATPDAFGVARGLGARCHIVTPLPLPGVAVEFTVAGCHGARLGSARPRRRSAAARAT